MIIAPVKLGRCQCTRAFWNVYIDVLANMPQPILGRVVKAANELSGL